MRIFVKKLIIVMLMVGLVFLLSSCGKSEETAKIVEQVLHVETIFGKVFIVTPNDEKINVRTGMKLAQGAVIATEGKDSRCMLRTPAGSMIKLGGDSKLVLSVLYKNNKLNTEKTGLSLLAGKVLVKANKLAGKDEFAIKTKTAVAGVRGTQFIVEYYGDDEVTKVVVKEGKVAVAQKLTVKMPKALSDMDKEVSKQVSEYSTLMVTASQTVSVSKKHCDALSSKCEKIIKASVSKIKNSRSSVKALLKVKLQKLVKTEVASSDVPSAKVMTKKEKAKYEKKDFKDLDVMYKKAVAAAKKIALIKQKLEIKRLKKLRQEQAKLDKQAKLNRIKEARIAKRNAKARVAAELIRKKKADEQAVRDRQAATDAAKIADAAKRKAAMDKIKAARKARLERMRQELRKKQQIAASARQRAIDKEKDKYKKNTSADMD